ALAGRGALGADAPPLGHPFRRAANAKAHREDGSLRPACPVGTSMSPCGKRPATGHRGGLVRGNRVRVLDAWERLPGAPWWRVWMADWLRAVCREGAWLSIAATCAV